MRLLCTVIPLIMLITASPAVMAEEECRYKICDFDGHCSEPCVYAFDNIMLERGLLETTSNTDTSNSVSDHTATSNSNSVSDRIASLLERIERLETATHQHIAQTASSTSHQPITGIVDTDEYNPGDEDVMPFRRAQVGLRPSTDDGFMEQHITMPELMERMARIEKTTNYHTTQQHDDDNDDEPQTGIIGTDEEKPGDDGPGERFYRGQFGPHSFHTENSQYPELLERHHSNSHHAEQFQHLGQHNTNTNTQIDDQGYPIQFGGVAKEDGSWFTYASGAADEPSEDDYFSMLERHASEPQTGIIGTDEEIPVDEEEGPSQRFMRGQFAPHTMIQEDEDDDQDEFTAMMERIQHLEHKMNMAEQQQQQQQQQQQSSLLEASTTTQHHSRLRRLRAAIDAART